MNKKYGKDELNNDLRELLKDALNNRVDNTNSALIRTLTEMALRNKNVMDSLMVSRAKVAVKDYVSELIERDVFRISTAKSLGEMVIKNIDVKVSKNTFYRAASELTHENPRYFKKYRIGRQIFYANASAMSDEELELLDNLALASIR